MPGGKAGSLPKERGFLSRLPPGQALIQVRRAKQLSWAYKESSPSLDPRMGAA